MRYIKATVWAALAAAWVIPIFQLCAVLGGCQWIELHRQTRAVALSGSMIALCSLAAFFSLTVDGIPKLLRICMVVVAGIHIFNAVGTYLFMSTNGHIHPIFMLPFRLIGSLAPTVFITNESAIIYFLLPLVCVVLVGAKGPDLRASAGADA